MKKITILAVTAVALAAAVPASAQEMKPTGLSLKIGGFMPTDKGTRDIGTVWLALGADFKLSDSKLFSSLMSNGALSVSLDYASKGGVRRLPLLLNYTGDLNEKFYGTFGAGADFTKAGNGMGASDTKFAYQVGIGYKLPSTTHAMFVEGRFLGSEKANMNGFGVYFGVRM